MKAREQEDKQQGKDGNIQSLHYLNHDETRVESLKFSPAIKKYFLPSPTLSHIQANTRPHSSDHELNASQVQDLTKKDCTKKKKTATCRCLQSSKRHLQWWAHQLLQQGLGQVRGSQEPHSSCRPPWRDCKT
ncbi:hypothetical protein NC651_037078 [Populus alba x Populus x berolinensis]|nr:hypothetical protein NC651_037078 [Populus alba x Populus x berolinensis]